MIMKKVDRHICKGFLKAFSLSLLAFLNIFIISQIFRVIKYISEGKMGVEDALYYFLTLIPKILIDVTPLSVMLGGLISMNVMASNLEIISLKTSGISFRRIIIFPVIISFFISIGIYRLNDKIAPKMYEKTRILRGSDKENKEIPIEKENAFLRGEGNHVYYAKVMNRETNLAEDIEIIDLNEDFNKIERVIVAKKGKYSEKLKYWELESVEITNVSKGTAETYKEYKAVDYKEAPSKFITERKDPRTLTISELKKEMKKLKLVGKDIKEFTQELSKRYSYPFASFFICFIGLALGSKYVRGATARNVALAILFGYGYYLLDGVFEAISKNGFLNPFVAGWIPNLLFLGLGIHFLKEAEY